MFNSVYNTLYQDQEINISSVANVENVHIPVTISAIKRSQELTRAKIHADFQSAVARVAEVAAGVSDPSQVVPGDIVPALQALSHEDGQNNVDIRPHLLDKTNDVLYLVDSGSFVTATTKLPTDEVRPDILLTAANDTRIPCYGFREIEVQINRKKYPIQAAITDIQKPILGWDFVKKYKMNFEWVGEEITFYDKKAQIRAPLQYAAIPHQSSPSMRSIEVINIDQESDSPVNNVAFQIASVLPPCSLVMSYCIHPTYTQYSL